MKKIKIPPKPGQAWFRVKIEVSARHIHLSQKDLAKLFGKGYKLRVLRQLSQTGEFAAKETAQIILATHPRRLSVSQIAKMRVVGPARRESQIEISRTDAIQLGVDAPLRLSGDLKGVKSYLKVRGPKGNVCVKVIVAKRHLHASIQEAKRLGLKNNQKVKVQVHGERGLVFEQVVVRIGENYCLSCHIDTDEANACGFFPTNLSRVSKFFCQI